MIARVRARLGRFLLLGILGSALTAPLWGQCAMCKESAKYQRAGVLDAINRGILVLAIPPMAIAAGIAWVTYRYRNGSSSQRPRYTPEIST